MLALFPVMFNAILIFSVYGIILFLYFRDRDSRMFSRKGQQSMRSEEKKLKQLEHIRLDLPEGVHLLPPGAADPSLRFHNQDFKNG